MPTIRRLYLYLVALIGLMALMVALIGLAAEFIRLWLNASPWQITRAELSQGGLLRWAAVAVISLPLWASHWLLANRAARPLTMAGAFERNAAARKAYFYAGQFSAVVTLLLLAGLALYQVLLRGLGGAVALSEMAERLPVSLGDWPAPPVAGGIGALVAFLFWLHLHQQARADGDIGHEPGAGAGWRRIYQYLTIFLGTALAAAGAAEFLRIVLELGGQLFYTLGGAPAASGWRETIALALAAVLTGLPLALLSWQDADWVVADDASGNEANSLARKLLIYAILLAGVLGTLVSGGFLVMVAALLLLGLPVSDPSLFWRDTLAPPLAYLPVSLLLWWIFGRAVHNDLEWAAETPDAAVLRRLYFYVMAALALAGLWYGLQQTLSIALFLLLGLEPAAALREPTARNTLGLAVALLVAGGPTWWWHWQQAQGWARQPGPAGQEERASLLRRIYLYAVVLAAAAVVVVALGIVIYRAPSWLFDPHPTNEFAGAVVQLGVSVTLGLLWWIGTGVVMRTDARLAAAETGAAGLAAGFPQVPAAWMAALPDEPPRAPGPAAIDASPVEPGAGAAQLRPGQYDRSQLPRLAPSAPAPEPPEAELGAPSGEAAVAVVDGGDGRIGALLVDALRRQLPQVRLWPVGLNDAAQAAMDGALGLPVLPDIPPDALEQAVAILGPNDIVIPGGLAGEVPPALAAAVVESPARKILLPSDDPRLRWVAAPTWSAERWVQKAVAEVAGLLNGQ